MRALFSFLRELYALYARTNIMRSAGALAFFFVLSFFPLLLCVTALVGLSHGEIQQLLLSLEPVLPRAALELAASYVDYAAQIASPALLCTAIPAILLSASACLRVVLDTMDELFDRPRATGLRRTLTCLLFSGLFPVALSLSVPVIFTGGWFFARSALPVSLWRWLRYLLLFFLTLLLVLILYRLGLPKDRLGLPPTLAGAALCSGTLVAASAVFSRLIHLSSRYSLLYGSLASFMILLLWLYLCGTILLLGAALLLIWTKKHPKP